LIFWGVRGWNKRIGRALLEGIAFARVLHSRIYISKIQTIGRTKLLRHGIFVIVACLCESSSDITRTGWIQPRRKKLRSAPTRSNLEKTKFQADSLWLGDRFGVSRLQQRYLLWTVIQLRLAIGYLLETGSIRHTHNTNKNAPRADRMAWTITSNNRIGNSINRYS
jgi:hypothetical protein